MRRGGVVNQHGEGTERRFSKRNQLLDLQFVPNIRAEERSASAPFFNEADGLVSTGFVDIRNDNDGAVRGEPNGNGAAAA
jgi:hypothetical protein